MARPLPFSSTEGHCWSFINAKINLPLLSLSLSLSLSATVYLQCGYVVIVYVPSYSCLVLVLLPPISFCVSPPLFVLPFVLPLYCSPLSLSPMAHRQRLCEWLSEKITLLLQTNSSFFRGLLVLYSVQKGRRKSSSSEICLLLALKNAPPLRIQGRVSQRTAGPNGMARLMQS